MSGSNQVQQSPRYRFEPSHIYSARRECIRCIITSFLFQRTFYAWLMRLLLRNTLTFCYVMCTLNFHRHPENLYAWNWKRFISHTEQRHYVKYNHSTGIQLVDRTLFLTALVDILTV